MEALTAKIQQNKPFYKIAQILLYLMSCRWCTEWQTIWTIKPSWVPDSAQAQRSLSGRPFGTAGLTGGTVSTGVSTVDSSHIYTQTYFSDCPFGWSQTLRLWVFLFIFLLGKILYKGFWWFKDYLNVKLFFLAELWPGSRCFPSGDSCSRGWWRW